MEADGTRDKILDVSSCHSSGTQDLYFRWMQDSRLCLNNAKMPWRKDCDPTNYPDVFSIKMLNIWLFVPIQVIGWVWPFSSGGLAGGKRSPGGRDFVRVYVWWSAKLDNLLLIRLPLGAKYGDKICLLLSRPHPRLLAPERWHRSKEVSSAAGTFWLLVNLPGDS